jgi:hypothetical protein
MTNASNVARTVCNVQQQWHNYVFSVLIRDKNKKQKHVCIVNLNSLTECSVQS